MRASNSRIQCFKQCRRKYWLKYIEGLEYNRPIEALEHGKSYHAKLEEIYTEGYFTPDEDIKTNAMAMAYEKYIFPKFQVQAVEEWFEKPVGDHTLIGRIDGKTTGAALVEHKTTSAKVDDEYIFGLQFDEQILSYMWAYGVNQIYYTVCQKPTIRQKKNEEEEDFQNRCVAWFDEDTDSKIRVILVTRSQQEIDAFAEDLEKMMKEMESCQFFYRNQGNCMRFGRRCEYASVCLAYDPDLEYVDFKKIDRAKDERHEQPAGAVPF